MLAAFVVAAQWRRSEHRRKITTIISIIDLKKPLEHQWRLCFADSTFPFPLHFFPCKRAAGLRVSLEPKLVFDAGVVNCFVVDF